MRRAGLVLVSVAYLGCSESSPRVHVAVSDSAGVVIVSNGQQQLATVSRWHLGSSPSMSIQSDEEGVTLFQVSDIARTESGVVAAVNSGTDEILLFDGGGGFLGRRGREGDGPGEFRRLSTVLALGGDSIGAYDSAHKRLSIFGPGGDVAREVTLAAIQGGSAYEKLFLLANGEVAVFTQGPLMSGGPGEFRLVSESYSIGRDGVRTGSFGRFEGAEVFVGESGAGMVLFGANSYAAVVGSQFVSGTAEEPELRFYAADAGLRRIVRWPDHDRRVADDRVEEFMAAAEASQPEAARPQVRSMFVTWPKSERQPAYEDVLAAPSGELWVGDYQGPEMVFPGARSPVRDWLVFDHAGGLVARVSTPLGFQPLYVGKDDIIGVFTDEFGVESIEAYEVNREPLGGNDS